MTAALEVRPVGVSEVEAVGWLFGSARTTRHCWCMSFCTGRASFAAGWFGGGNRRRFESMAGQDGPMGVLAYDGDAPVGWAACGPRMRYREVNASGRRLLVQRPRAEDLSAWLLPCIFVHADYRGQGVSHALVEAVVSTARHEGAVALEGWPLAQDEARSADAFVGREELFDALGFRRVAEPVPGRVIMRLDLVAD